MDEILQDELIIEELDVQWIEEFDKIDNKYAPYYVEDVSYITCRCIYINDKNHIEKIHKENFLLKQMSVLSKEELIYLIKNNIFLNKKRYSLLSILNFNISISPEHLNTFLKQPISTQNKHLNVIKNLDNIKFNKSISLFHDINELVLVFQNKMPNALTTTKKIQITHNKYTKRNL